MPETCRSDTSHDVEELWFVYWTVNHRHDGGSLLVQCRTRRKARRGSHFGADRTFDCHMGVDPIRPTLGLERGMGLAALLYSIQDHKRRMDLFRRGHRSWFRSHQYVEQPLIYGSFDVNRRDPAIGITFRR